MPYYLTKILPLLLMPISIALALALVALLLLLKKKQKGAAFSLLAAVFILWISSLPSVAGKLVWSLERQYPPMPIDEIPQEDCIIVLGGVLGAQLFPRVETELTEAIDRVYQAARLYRSGKGKTLIITAGNQPWQQQDIAEAELIKGILEEWGVDRQSIVLDSSSRNTHENAENGAVLVRESGCRTSLLVTSAWHMPRAVASFNKSGVDVVPVSVDVHLVSGPFTSVAGLIPQAEALATTSRMIHEWMGIWVYRWRGWN